MQETETINIKQQMREAVTAAKLGHKNLARKLLYGVVEHDPKHEEAWLWCAALAEIEEEAQRCLTQVLDINPNNQHALNALALARLRHAARKPPAARPVTRGNVVGERLAVPPPTEQVRVAPEAQTPPPEPAWHCPLCLAPAEKPLPRCRRCGSLLLMENLDDLSSNRDADEGVVQESIQRLLRELKSNPTADSHFWLACAFLNLNRSAEALPHLQKASELKPGDGRLRALLEGLQSRRLVLTVDDSLTVRKIVAMTLERHGYRVLSAMDGMQALSRLNEHQPDLILLDITMPRMDGYQVCKTIKQNSYTKQIPVLMLSGKDGFFDKVKGKLAGATDYLTKPFQEEELIKAVQKHMRSRA